MSAHAKKRGRPLSLRPMLLAHVALMGVLLSILLADALGVLAVDPSLSAAALAIQMAQLTLASICLALAGPALQTIGHRIALISGLVAYALGLGIIVLGTEELLIPLGLAIALIVVNAYAWLIRLLLTGSATLRVVDARTPAGRHDPSQWSTRQILASVAVAAALFGLARLVYVFPDDPQPLGLLVSGLAVLNAVVLTRAILSSTLTTWHIASVVVVTLATCLLFALALADVEEPKMQLLAYGCILHNAIVLASLAYARACGYRLVSGSGVTEHAPTSRPSTTSARATAT